MTPDGKKQDIPATPVKQSVHVHQQVWGILLATVETPLLFVCVKNGGKSQMAA